MIENAVGPTSLVTLTKGVTVEITFTALTPGDNRPRFTFVTEEQAAELKSQRWSDYASREIHNPQRARPDAQGKAVLKAMPPGKYSVWQPPKNYVIEPETFEVPPVDFHTVEIRWSIQENSNGNANGLSSGELELMNNLGYFGDG